MLCRKLRCTSWRGLFPALGVCLAVIGGMVLLPPAWLEDEIPSLTAASHTLPLTAIAENSGLRFEKQAQSQRPFLKRPERTSRPSAGTRVSSLRSSALRPRAFRGLPRRHLYAPRSGPSAPDDPSHSPLS